jgi:predicted Zn-dependent protease with MMP-like domain
MSSVRTSQETHYVSATKPNRLMLFREIIAVYCEYHTEHTNTLCGQNAEFSSYLAGNILRVATKPNRLMLFRETVAVYCENHTEHTNTLCGQNILMLRHVVNIVTTVL